MVYFVKSKMSEAAIMFSVLSFGIIASGKMTVIYSYEDLYY